MLKDLLDKFKFSWTPDRIMSSEEIGTEPLVDAQYEEDVKIAQALADHLNLIDDFKNRYEALDYLANQAKANFGNITYTTTDENLINSIIIIGGKDGIVDFNLILDAIDLVIQWIDVTAADGISAAYNGKI